MDHAFQFDDIRKPDLFILGAPKCGTTSLVEWFRQHPEVFVCPEKEPCVFYHPNRKPMSWKAYKELYTEAALEKYRSVLEASIWYLYSEKAILSVLSFSPKAKFIVCLRNPVDLFFSLHRQKIFSGQERIENYEDAWNASDRRQAGEMFGISGMPNGDPSHMAYKEVCSLGMQVERLLKHVPKDEVRFVFLEDLNHDPSGEFASICGWAQLSTVCSINFSPVNQAKDPKSLALTRATLWLANLKRTLGFTSGTGVLAIINKLNSSRSTEKPVDPKFLEQLLLFFSPDISKLSDLTGRDLSSWLSR